MGAVTAAPAYTTVHDRLRRERGRAADYACVLCTRPAEEWAFDEPSGWSADLDRYRPMCCSCHARTDGRVNHFPKRRKRRR